MTAACKGVECFFLLLSFSTIAQPKFAEAAAGGRDLCTLFIGYQQRPALCNMEQSLTDDIVFGQLISGMS